MDKAPADEVFAGSINGEGALEIDVSRPAADNTIARIVHMVEQAQAQRAPSRRFVDRFARIYTPAVIALAAGIAVVPPLLLGAPFADWLYRALVLLVISCPCALVLSTPVTIVSAISSAARQGILVKGGAYLEKAGAIRAVAFDKTGTLTVGRPRVTDVVSLNGHDEQELLTIAAALEGRSEHMLGQAIVEEARGRGFGGALAEEFHSLAGRGASAVVAGVPYVIGSPRLMRERLSLDARAEETIERLQGEGRSVALLLRGQGCDDDGVCHIGEPHVLGVIGLSDQPRAEAAPALAALKGRGVERTVMLTATIRARRKYGAPARRGRGAGGPVAASESGRGARPDRRVP